MKRDGKRRAAAWLGMLTVGAGALTALVLLYSRPARSLRPAFSLLTPPPAIGAADAETPGRGVSTAQILLADASARLGAAAPPESAALLKAAERAVRAVLPGEKPVFAQYGVPGVGIALLDDRAALVSGVAALESGKRLRYRVRVLFLPGGYREAAWPDFTE